MSKAEQALNVELNTFQQRLQRCAMGCRDSVQDRVPTGGGELSPAQVTALQSEVEKCANSCVDDHLKLLPKMRQRVEAVVQSS